MPHSKPVRACLCYKRTFVELKTLAEANRWQSVGEITAQVGCGGKCRLCAPYLQRMLDTGDTAFAILPSEKAEA